MPPNAKARFIDPMLLLRTDSLPNDGDRWEDQLKFDGYRAIAFKTGGKVYLRSRNDNDFSVRYSAVMNGSAKLPDETVIDVEVIALDEDGRPSRRIRGWSTGFSAKVGRHPTPTGTRGMKQLTSTCPDLKVTNEEILQEGNKVIVRSQLIGKQHGDFVGLAPKNRALNMMAIDIHKFRDGKIVRTWHTEDWLSGLHQLGAFEM